MKSILLAEDFHEGFLLQAGGATGELSANLQGFIEVIAHGELDLEVLPQAELSLALNPCQTAAVAVVVERQLLGAHNAETEEAVNLALNQSASRVVVKAADLGLLQQGGNLGAGAGQYESSP